MFKTFTFLFSLLRKNISYTQFATMDIETMVFNTKQIAIGISMYIYGIGSKLFFIDSTIKNTDSAVNKLWKEYFDYKTKTYSGVIFVLNLGSFDSYFIYKNMSN